MQTVTKNHCVSRMQFCKVVLEWLQNPATTLNNHNNIIKTHGSESRGQEEAGRTRRTSELFTRSNALKFVNALNKPPLKLSLSYHGLSKF